MRPRLINLEALTKALRPYLKPYLEEHGIDTTKNFKCIDPKHEDNNASMHLYEDTGYIHCFGCQSHLNLYNVCSILENKPTKGKEWLDETVLYLAKKYNIEINIEDLTHEEVYEYRTYQAYKAASEIISNREIGDYSIVDQEIERRGWDKEKVASWGLGTVNYNDFRDRLKKAGFEPKLLDGIDLSNPGIFSENNLIFTVYDDEDRPVGFSARRLDYKEGEGNKYINTKQTGLECAIFKKGERLYGYNVAKDASAPLYIFEGQASVITARHHGLLNCCCTMGTNITDHHVTLLKKHGSFDVVLVFDGDIPGQKATAKVVDNKFAHEKDIKLRLIELPDSKDPDEIIRLQGYKYFQDLKRWTVFEWRMLSFMKSIEGEPTEEIAQEVAEKMTPLIVAEQSLYRQEEMAKQVAKVTGYDLSTIMAEVKRQRSEKEAEVHALKRNAIEALLYSIKKNPEDAEIALSQCQSAINDINRSTNTESETSLTLSRITGLKELDESRSGEFMGFRMKPEGLGGIAIHMNDDWKRNSLIYLGGAAQSAKTSLAVQMAYEILCYEQNNAICIYYSIDDAIKFITYKLVCNGADNLRLNLSDVANPAYCVANKPDAKELLSLRDKGYREIAKLAEQERLILRDASNGTSLNYIRPVVYYYKEKYPTKNIVLFIDNFHKLSDYQALQESVRTKKLSNDLKNLTTELGITIVATVEYKKMEPGQMPDNYCIAESRSLVYDSTAILHLYNQLNIKGSLESVLVHEDEQGNIMPRIRCKFGKNKITGFEDRVFLDLYPCSARMLSVDTKVAEEDMLARQTFLNENASKNQF